LSRENSFVRSKRVTLNANGRCIYTYFDFVNLFSLAIQILALVDRGGDASLFSLFLSSVFLKVTSLVARRLKSTGITAIWKWPSDMRLGYYYFEKGEI